jgi:hypothetical protein
MDSCGHARCGAWEEAELAKHRAERPKLQQQFADLKRGLADAKCESRAGAYHSVLQPTSTLILLQSHQLRFVNSAHQIFAMSSRVPPMRASVM